MGLDKEILKNKLRELDKSMYYGYDRLSDAEKLKVDSFLEIKSSQLADIIHDYIISAEVEVSSGVIVGSESSSSEKLLTKQKGVGKLK